MSQNETTLTVPLDAADLFGIKTALLHSVRYYERRLLQLEQSGKRHDDALKECKQVKSALVKIDAALEEVIGIGI